MPILETVACWCVMQGEEGISEVGNLSGTSWTEIMQCLVNTTVKKKSEGTDWEADQPAACQAKANGAQPPQVGATTPNQHVQHSS
jgi:hypothetical protein